MTKICSNPDCGKEKDISEFSYRKNRKGDRVLNGQCKVCINLKHKKFVTKEYQQKYRENNKEKHTEYCRNYYKENKEEIIKAVVKYSKNRKNSDVLYKLTHNIRSLINISFRSRKIPKSSKTKEILGCTFEEFKLHLENQFEPWMTWENRGKYKKDTYNYGWDLDHITPVSSAINEEGVIALNHYTNFKPLCSKVNRDIKKNTLIF